MGVLPRESLDYAVDFLKRLIAIPTVAPDGSHYKEAADFLAGELSKLGFQVEVVEVPREYQAKRCRGASDKPRYIVLGRLEAGGRRLHFNGHYDVVPGGSGWTVTEPFRPVVVNGRVYGRGAVDMKGGIAAVFGALHALQASGEEPAHTVEVALVPDEEIGGECGTGYLVEEVLDTPPDYVVIPEPSGLEHPWHGHKGLLWARITVVGRNAHASTPWRGRNAFLAAARLALSLHESLSAAYSTRWTAHKTLPPEAGTPTFMIGGEAGVPGGGKTNQVPGEFYFTVDRRLLPEESVEQARRELEAALRWAATGLAGVEYRVEYTAEMEPAANDPGELLEALRRAGERVGVRIGDPVLCPGGLDLRYYTRAGSKTLAYGPDGSRAHEPDEYIEVEELEKLAAVFLNLMRREAWG